MISLLSYIAVLLSFLARYSSSIHSPTSLNSRQNILYSLCLFSSLAGCGLQKPRKKSGGLAMTHGLHRQCGQWSSPLRIGRTGLFLYPFGWPGWLSSFRSNYKYTDTESTLPWGSGSGFGTISHTTLARLSGGGLSSKKAFTIAT